MKLYIQFPYRALYRGSIHRVSTYRAFYIGPHVQGSIYRAPIRRVSLRRALYMGPYTQGPYIYIQRALYRSPIYRAPYIGLIYMRLCIQGPCTSSFHIQGSTYRALYMQGPIQRAYTWGLYIQGSYIQGSICEGCISSSLALHGLHQRSTKGSPYFRVFHRNPFRH